MGMQNKKSFMTAGALVLLALSGCAGSGSGSLAWLSPSTYFKRDEPIDQLLAPKQQQIKPGKQTSLYPPGVMVSQSVPKTEKDLKKPIQLHLSYAKLQEQLGHIAEARSSYEKVISKEPQSVEANIGLGRLDALAGHTEKAEQRFRKAIEIAPDSAEAYFAYGKFLESQNRYTEAIVELQKAVQKKPETKYKFEIGLALARSGQYEQAAATLSNLVGQAEAHYNVGYIALKERQDSITAQKYLKNALQLNPDLEQARYWLAEIKSSSRKIVTASGVHSPSTGNIQHALKIQPASHHNRESLIPTTVPETSEAINPDNLTPEQWEQWKNQQELQ